MHYVGKIEVLLPGLNIHTVEERRPLGTIGPLSLLQDLPQSFLVMNCDVLTTLHAANFLRRHRSSGAMLTIATTRRSVSIPYGVLVADDNGELRNFLEKPTEEHQVSMGIYAMDHRVLSFIEPRVATQFDDLVLRLLDADVRVRTFESDELWIDIGTPEEYEKAKQVFGGQDKAMAVPLKSTRKA